MTAVLRFGTAGWSFQDWDGIVYPRPLPRGFDRLSFIKTYLDAVEINSTFYRPPSEKVCQGWLEKILDRPDFRFTAKLWQRFTHEREPYGKSEVAAFRKGMDILLDSGRLGALLIQFPWSFKNVPENRKWLDDILSVFSDYPLVLEVRHASWNKEDFYSSLRERETGFVNIDQPVFARSIRPSKKTTSLLGYVRLHGRNYENWFKEGAGRDERYDYLYSREDLEPWANNIKELARECSEVYIVANNHFKGKAVVNALELKNIVTKKKVKAPPGLLETYPRLDKIADKRPVKSVGQQKLF